jgi:tetratricopeptide (TPR) repeat protein
MGFDTAEPPVSPEKIPASLPPYLGPFIWLLIVSAHYASIRHTSHPPITELWSWLHSMVDHHEVAVFVAFVLQILIVNSLVATLLHAGAKLLGGKAKLAAWWWIYMPVAALFDWAAVVMPGGQGSLWSIIFVRIVIYWALAARVYSLSVGQAGGAWILAISMAGAVLVPLALIKQIHSFLNDLTSPAAKRRKTAAPISAVAGPDELTANLLHQRALEAIHERHYDEAMKLLSQTLLLRRRLGQQTMDLAATYYEIGEVYSYQHEWKTSENYYRQALLIAQDLLKEDDPELGKFLNGLGSVYFSQNRGSEAEVLHKKALAIIEPVKDKKPDLYALFLTNYANDLKLLGAENTLEWEKKATEVSKK